ncbi:SDR family oxidoreductase [Planctomycetales bacterium ZRK34]|nr:SDR family oxidoreductase [Planctomycetales bacterium ZRK34]
MRILVTGAGGQLGPYLIDAVSRAGCELIAWRGRDEVDLTDADAVRQAYERAAADVVIHAAAMSRPALAFAEPEAAQAVNVDATRQLVELADRAGARLIYVSTDMVFDGEAAPYAESAATAPRSVYGRTKLAGEKEVLAVAANMVVRVSLLYGPSRRSGFKTLFDQQVAAMRAGEKARLFEDEWRTPLAINDAAAGLVAAAQSEARGLYHLGGPERLSRFEMGRQLAELLGAPASCLQGCSRLSIESDEPRPRDLSLDSTRWSQAFAHSPRRRFTDAARAFLNI